MSILSFKRRTAPPAASGRDCVEVDVDVQELKQNDEGSWKRVYDEHYPAVRRHIAYLIHDVPAAEDLAQDVFLQAMKSIARFEGNSSLSTWLFAIANRLVYKHWRSRGRQDRAYEKVRHVAKSSSGSDPDRDYLSAQRAQALKTALTRIPDNLREAFVLVDVQRVETKVAAQRLGISTGNLAVRASRARAKIREELERDGWIDTSGDKCKELPS